MPGHPIKGVRAIRTGGVQVPLFDMGENSVGQAGAAQVSYQRQADNHTGNQFAQGNRAKVQHKDTQIKAGGHDGSKLRPHHQAIENHWGQGRKQRQAPPLHLTEAIGKQRRYKGGGSAKKDVPNANDVGAHSQAIDIGKRTTNGNTPNSRRGEQR